MQAQGIKKKGDYQVDGAICQDYMEHFSISSAALVFCLVQWTQTLTTETARASAGKLFDRILNFIMGTGEYTLIVNREQQVGTLTCSGVVLHVQGGHIQNVQYLSAHSKWVHDKFRSKRDRALIYDGSPPEMGSTRVGLRQLLKFLFSKAAKDAMCIFWAIIFWLASLIDGAEAVSDASEGVLDGPVLRGPAGRSKKLSRSYKDRVAQLAAKGEVFKSGQSVMKGMKLLGLTVGRAEKTGDNWMQPRAFRYLHKVQQVFDLSRLEWPIICWTWDATRLSGLETLFSAVYTPLLDLAAWAPPQVLPVLIVDLRAQCIIAI